MSRPEALQLWQRIASGDLLHLNDHGVDELHAWIQTTAKQVITADAESTGRRPDALVSAIGLSGKADPHAALRAFVLDALWDFPVLGKDGQVLEETRGQLIRQMASRAREQGLLRGVYAEDDKKAHDLIRNLLPARKA
jgi:hypothetical protein